MVLCVVVMVYAIGRQESANVLREKRGGKVLDALRNIVLSIVMNLMVYVTMIPYNALVKKGMVDYIVKKRLVIGI